jgi:dynein heavy chain
VKDLKNKYDNVVGDILLAAGVVAYMGCFTTKYREQAIQIWAKKMKKAGVSCASDFSLASTLGNNVKIRGWTIAKLPNDAFSICNAIIMEQSNRYPLMIDPQGQANRWVKNMEGDALCVVKQSQATFVRTIEVSIQFGKPVLLENVPEEIDPILEPLLLKQTIKVGGVPNIQFGENMVEYDESFKLYITTTLPNPHFPPETCVKVALLNFMATEEGFQDQMLGITVKNEAPDLERQREELVLEDAQNKAQLQELEDTILKLLSAASGNILEDEVLVDTLSSSKATSVKIEQKVMEAANTQELIYKA